MYRLMLVSPSANSNFDFSGAIGSWSPPETSSSNSNRNGLSNVSDGSTKSDAIFDDGTAIWGNPITKKTGIDWTEKESKEQTTNNNINLKKELDKQQQQQHVHKHEPSISSLNGTEAWGAPQIPIAKINRNSNDSLQSKLNSNNNNDDTSGNNFGTSESIGWGGESSSLLRAADVANNQNSSPPTNPNPVWSNLGLSNNNSVKHQQQLRKPSYWLNSSTSVTNPVSALDELTKQQRQIEPGSNSLFDSISGNKSSLDNQSIGVVGGIGGRNSINVGSIGSGSAQNHHISNSKQISANYSNSLFDPPNRHLSNSLTGDDQQSQFDSAAYLNSGNNSLTAPSRDLLKQMVHQIQLAVQAGHLNAQVLNQPMSTPTLQLVYDLLQQIKVLHQLQEVQQQSGIVKSDLSSPTNLELQIDRIRQNISLLQKAITQQQQQQQQPTATTKNEPLLGGSSIMKQKQPQQKINNFSYANISSTASSNSGGLGLTFQSNPWMFPQRGLEGGGLIDSLNKINNIDNKPDDGHANLASSAKMMLGGDPLKMNTQSNTQARSSSSALFDWSSLAASTSAIQFKDSTSYNDNSLASRLVGSSSSTSSVIGRPGPPPGLLNTASLGHHQQANILGMNSLFDTENKLQSRDPSSSLWSGAWLD